MECCATTRNSSRPIVTCANDCSGFLGSRAKSPSSTELRQTVEGVADVAKRDEAEDRKTNEEREDPEQERGIPYLGAVVLDALRLLLLLHRLRDGGEELLVLLGLPEPLQEELGAFDLADGREHLPQQDHLPHDLGCEQHLLAARAGGRDVDRREGAALLELAVEDHLGVAGPLELLVDHVVHAGPRVDEACGEDRERSAAFDVSRGAEEALGWVERDRVHTTGQRPAGWWDREVVRACETSDRVEENHHVAAGLDEALRALQRELRDAGVVLGGLIERGREDLALDGSTDIGHFLGSLADEDDHDVDVLVIPGDAVCDVLQQLRLAGLRRRHDECALPVAEGVYEVDEALAEVRAVDLKVEHLVREDRHEVLEHGPALCLLRVDAVDRLDAQQAEVLLTVLRRSRLAGHEVARPKTEAAHLARADVHVLW